jgi:hypothetical protein
VYSQCQISEKWVPILPQVTKEIFFLAHHALSLSSIFFLTEEKFLLIYSLGSLLLLR